MRKFLGVTAFGLLLLSPAFGAKKDNDHNDAFIPGDVNENKITQEVRHRLVTLPYYGVFDDLAFRVDGSTVTLLGQVAQPYLKSDAENVTKKVEGVTRVVNNIEVLPLSPMDDRLRLELARAIYGAPQLQKYSLDPAKPIRITVVNGNVTLSGVVDTKADRDVAGLRANGVPGAFKVVNNLQVAGSEKGS